MGLIKAAAGAFGGTMADQWKEFFYCDAIDKDVLVVKGEKRVGGRSSNKKGSDNIISSGSGIAVADGQCMIIVEQGKVVEVCAEPGQFTYDASTEPSIFAGSLGEGIHRTFDTVKKRFTFGTHKRGHYDQTVYYVKVSVTNGENGNLETVIAAHTDADMTDAKCDITFTNYYKPIKKTSESTTETIPTTKRKPETKPGNKTSIKKSKNKVKTGDNSNATLFAILLLVSGTGLLIIAISRYREKYHK